MYDLNDVVTDYFENCRPYLECVVHLCDEKHFPLDSTARSRRKQRGNEVEEWSFINKLYLATDQMQTQARLKINLWILWPGPACVPSHTSERNLGADDKTSLITHTT